MPPYSVKKKAKERRHAPRTPLGTVVRMTTARKTTELKAENHSKTGLFVKTTSPDTFALDEIVEIRFTEEEGQTHEHKGQVIRKSSEGIALIYWGDEEPSAFERP